MYLSSIYLPTYLSIGRETEKKTNTPQHRGWLSGPEGRMTTPKLGRKITDKLALTPECFLEWELSLLRSVRLPGEGCTR